MLCCFELQLSFSFHPAHTLGALLQRKMVKRRSSVSKPHKDEGQARDSNSRRMNISGVVMHGGTTAANEVSGSFKIDNRGAVKVLYWDMKVDALRAELQKRKLVTWVVLATISDIF